jgi:ParB family transcriptional regulator, chromosome partitioning protein
MYHNSIFWVETDKISPNPYQPRREFDERALQDLADSVRQYGILQPLVVTRQEIDLPDGGMRVSYELIAGERRLRAAQKAGLPQVPVIIRAQAEDGRLKLELAIIENLQREDLNPIDRAHAFKQLAEEFKLSQSEIGKKMGKSREYVANTMRLLSLPQEIQTALGSKQLSEGHTRSLMMLASRPDEQKTLFTEILVKKLSVRESEKIARSIAKERARKREVLTPEFVSYQEQLSQTLGTRVSIETREAGVGGKVVIDFISPQDLELLLKLVQGNATPGQTTMLQSYLANHVQHAGGLAVAGMPIESSSDAMSAPVSPDQALVMSDMELEETIPEFDHAMDDRGTAERSDDENRVTDEIMDSFTV